MGVMPNASTAALLWFNVTAQLGCGDASSDSASVLSCMRTKDTADITKVISTVSSFTPYIDGVTTFSDYQQRSLAGNLIKKPMLIGYDDRESGMFDITSRMSGVTLPQAYWDVFDLQGFFCPAAIRANASVYNDVPVWRYRYFGVFENMQLSSTIDAGAWHGVEINQIFDTVPKGEGIPASTKAEVALGKYMRRAWATFAKDPARGLKLYGWPQFDPAKKTLIRLGWENTTGLNVASPQEYDAACGSPFPID
jgi:carboxylesterase type B